MIRKLGGKITRSTVKKPPTDLVWAHAATGQDASKVEEPEQVRYLRAKGVEIHGPEWLLDLQKNKKGENSNAKSLRSIVQTESSIRKPSRQNIPVSLSLADGTKVRARGGQRCSRPVRTDSTLNIIIRDTLKSNSQDKEATAVVKRDPTRQHAPAKAQNRSVEHLKVLGIYTTPLYSPKKAGEVYIRRIPAPHCDDEDRNCVVIPGVDSRRQFVKLLGQGGFGRVIAAHDREHKKLVAIKVMQPGQIFRDAARSELRVLETLKLNDEENHNRCIHLRTCF
ncbi:CMGC CLK kinase, partial [Fusarium albosuccineum]